MVRTPRSQTKNRSLLESHIEEQCWSDIACKFNLIKLDDKIDLVGSKARLKAIAREIDYLLNDSTTKPSFLLISGPPYSGKTTTVKKLAQQHINRLSFFHLNCSWIKKRSFGDPETSLNILYGEVAKKSPCLILIENIELSKDDLIPDLLNRFVINSNKVLIIAETRNPDLIDPRLTECTYFSYETKFALPTPDDRAEFIKNYLSRSSYHSLDEYQIKQIVKSSHCYSYGDLDRVCSGVSKYFLLDKKSTFECFNDVLKDYKPPQVKLSCKPCEPLTWDQIGGVDEAKRILQQSVLGPLKHRETFNRLGIKIIKGALLYGPPGCSKTLLARALATESGHNFIHIKAPELMSKYVGDSEAEVRKIYRTAKEIAPCIIFIDEIDCIAPTRGDEQNSVGSRLVTSLLLELNGVTKTEEVFTLGATNIPHRIDDALLRSERLGTHIYIPLPSETEREAIFRIHMSDIRTKFEEPIDDVVKRLASLTQGYSGAEIAEVCQTAGLIAFFERNDDQFIQWVDFESAIKKILPKTDYNKLKSYEKFSRRKQVDDKSSESLLKSKTDDHSNTTGTLTRLFSKLKIKRS